jgi:TRAP transporter TAXI family solute receptor
MNLQSKFKWLMAGVLIVSICLFYATRDSVPNSLVLYTGQPGGFYHQVGSHMTEAWEEATQRKLDVHSSSGSRENFQALCSAKADLALIQGGVEDLSELSIIAPLSHDLVHVIVRKDASIDRMQDLKGHTIAVGMPNSGMASSAEKLLHFYGLNEQNTQWTYRYFTQMKEDASIDAAVVTAGILNADLNLLLGSGDYRILPMEYAPAFCEKNAYFFPALIHKGLYRLGDDFLQEDIPTVATTALLVATKSISPKVIDQLLITLFEESGGLDSPVMLNAEEVREQQDLKLHPRAMQYFHPADQIGYMANVMESLAALKELAVAFVAGLYLLWDRWRRQQQKALARQLSKEKEKLDVLLAQTVDIERQYASADAMSDLQGMLRQVMQIKIQALEELTHEQLRGDRVFLIFMTQCSNLIDSIQSKMNRINSDARDNLNDPH